eukprot:m.253806 g.253806  ORF g.253806 m.253806 type:complete len:63 (-) comp16164_c2_seq1:5652-5840(-)
MASGGPRQYCQDCDTGAQIDGRVELAACLEKNGNDRSKCEAEWDRFQAAIKKSRELKQSKES